MSDGACAAGLDLLDLPARDAMERLACESLIEVVLEEVSAPKGGKTDELTAREDVAAGRHREETSTAATGRDVAHQPTGAWRQDGEEHVRKVGDDQLAAGLLEELIAAIERRQVVPGRGAVSRFEAASGRQRAADDVQEAGRHVVAVEKLHQLRQFAHVCLRHRTDDAPGVVSFEALHGGHDLAIGSLARPVLPRTIGNPGFVAV